MNDGIGLYCKDDDSWYTCRLAFAHLLTLEAALRGGLFAEVQQSEVASRAEEIIRAKRVNRAVLEYFAPGTHDLRTLSDIVDSLGILES